MSSALFESSIETYPLLFRGKVRDVYDLGKELLIVASDRLSAFDHVLPNPIPQKGEVLTQVSNFWMEKTKGLLPNHISEKRLEDVLKNPEELKLLGKRSVIAKKTKPLPVECIVRGYLIGSGYLEYTQTGKVSGIPLPKDLKMADKLAEPLFTPSTKAEQGEHDENISFEQMVELVGEKNAEEAKQLCLKIYQEAANYARERGIIIADTKFELGLLEGQLILIDEVLTPDSSRFWPADQYQVGISPPSYDKQFVRDYLLKINWNKQAPAPQLPEEIIKKTSEKYLEACEKLTGLKL